MSDTKDIRYPIWTIVDLNLQRDFPTNVPVMSLDGTYRVVMIFRDIIITNKFFDLLKSNGKELNFVACPLHEPRLVYQVLDHCQKNGAKYVALNPEYNLTPTGEWQIDSNSILQPIDHFRSALRTSISQPPFSSN